MVDNTSNFHFDTISSSLGISIHGMDYDPILDNAHELMHVLVKFYTNSVKKSGSVMKNIC